MKKAKEINDKYHFTMELTIELVDLNDVMKEFLQK